MGFWEIGHRYKLILKDGSIRTADLLAIEGELLMISDRNNVKRAIHKDEIREARDMGVGNGEERKPQV